MVLLRMYINFIMFKLFHGATRLDVLFPFFPYLSFIIYFDFYRFRALAYTTLDKL